MDIGSEMCTSQEPHLVARRRSKLQDHISPARSPRRKRRVIIGYKRARAQRFLRTHARRLTDQYFLTKIGGNFIESRNSIKKFAPELIKYCTDYGIGPASGAVIHLGEEQAQLAADMDDEDIPVIDLNSSAETEPEVIDLNSSAENVSPPVTPRKPSPQKPAPPPAVVELPAPVQIVAEKRIHTVEHTTPQSLGRGRPKSSHAHSSSPGLVSADGKIIRTPKRIFQDKLRAEASVMTRVAELQREGMWYERRLPKTHEPPRIKCHWDYLLEEMQWLAADFAGERKWKRIAARKCSKMVEKYFHDKELAEEKAKKDDELKVKKIASFIAKEIRNFWSNAQKLIEFKEQSRIEELKKKAMDQQLSFIVDQTEKFSSMLAETFSADMLAHGIQVQKSPKKSLRAIESSSQNASLSDDEFEYTQGHSEDDEETIALAETEAKDVGVEIDLLQKESEMSIDDILDDLPPEYVKALMKESSTVEEASLADVVSNEIPEDLASSELEPEGEYQPSGSGSDIEETIDEEERLEAEAGPHSYVVELQQLEDDTKLSVEELRKKYSGSVNEPNLNQSSGDDESSDPDVTSDSDEADESESEDSDEEGAEQASDIPETEPASPDDEEQQSSLASLLQTFAPERAADSHVDDELNSVAAMAESFQPKGYTLSSTTVATKIPVLLKHTLREYQHIGLDWLVTMSDKKLNGILADEMGLGKTIQTIALLAHLACEKGNWGPHLIIVPTSVMLNWEMEFHKWCPGFKILTYYGSIRERKLKRQGWTRPNSFHVCITSYKIVVQDHHSFRRKRWKYLILDEAQNIKNFKSQRWQLLLNFSTQRRLLLTGTPLQNNLMELWSLMHFLMPNVFQSHREFRDWFSNPVTGMIEGNSEYNDNIIRRLHKVLRPFILRRLKCEVERQLPKKFEHVVMCRLSKRQRFLYEDFMSRSKTRETLQKGSLLSVINVLMQLRKVCNHPNLFETRPIISPLQTEGLSYLIPSSVWNMMDEKDIQTVSYGLWRVTQRETDLDHYSAERIYTLRPPRSVLSVTKFNTIDELIVPHDMTDKDIEEHRAELMFQQEKLHASADAFCRANVYSYTKGPVPKPPRLVNPFSLFTTDTGRARALLGDYQFVATISKDAQPPQRLCHSDLDKAGWDKSGNKPDFSIYKYGSKPFPEINAKMTKLSQCGPCKKIGTLPNGVEVYITSNGVQYRDPIVPYSPKKYKHSSVPVPIVPAPLSYPAPIPFRESKYRDEPQMSTSSAVQDNSAIVEYNTVISLETVDSSGQPKAKKSRLDTAEAGTELGSVFEHIHSLDVDDCSTPKTYLDNGRTTTVIKDPIRVAPIARSSSNGFEAKEDEGSDEYEDSEEEFSQAPSKKIKLDKVVPKKGKKKKGDKEVVPEARVSKQLKTGPPANLPEPDEAEELVMTDNFGDCIRPRKIPFFGLFDGYNWLRNKGFDAYDFELEDVEFRRLTDRKSVIENMKRINANRLLDQPVYGQDLLDQVLCFGKTPKMRYFGKKLNPKPTPHRNWVLSHAKPYTSTRKFSENGYFNLGYDEIMSIKNMKTTSEAYVKNHPHNIWRHTAALYNTVWTTTDVLEALSSILKRFVVYTPAVAAPCIKMRVFKPTQSRYISIATVEQQLTYVLKQPLEILHPIMSSMRTQFPDPRLIQYDCGKLQTMATLLRDLKAGNHRVLIFTQMSKMLDVLEAFLNHHGYIYLRLDGSTKIDQRQLLMEKFNTDKKIFVFILSTRSGGIGVNLTGADTVIFYDSDWNPTMDAQAQDRCHRIGQTRDVHIYRLVSEKTVEENILKKSNQKRLLGELAIEGGNFTTAYFKKNTIHELFNVDDKETDATKRMAELLETPVESPDTLTREEEEVGVRPAAQASRRNAAHLLESALAAVEDETDVIAARTVCAEAAAELAEFDENIPLEDQVETQVEEPAAKIEQEMEYIMSELTPVEVYALRLMDDTKEDWSKETYESAQADLEKYKQDWEMEQLKKAEEKEKKKNPSDDDDDWITYSGTDARNQVWCSEGHKLETMPLWAPPTPPQDDEDVYLDTAIRLLYGPRPIPVEKLPAPWVPPKKPKSLTPTKGSTDDPNDKKGTSSQIKVHRREEPIFAPRSLFDRPSPAVAKLRRDYKLQKMNMASQNRLYTPPMSPNPPAVLPVIGKPAVGTPAVPLAVSIPAAPTKTVAATPSTPAAPDLVEWLSTEDYALLQAHTQILELPMNLMIVNLAQTPNWDLATEVVNMESITNRSVKQCKQRYDMVVLPREEGKIVVETAPKKKKLKSIIKITPPPPTPAKTTRLKTVQLVAADNNQTLKNIFFSKFETLSKLADKVRPPPPKQGVFTPNTIRTTKQSSIFSEYGINYEVVQNAAVIAIARHERMLADRAKMIQAQRAAIAEQLKASGYDAGSTTPVPGKPDSSSPYSGLTMSESAQLQSMILGSLDAGASSSVSATASGTTNVLPLVSSTPPVLATSSSINSMNPASSAGIVIAGAQTVSQRTPQTMLQHHQQVHLQQQQAIKLHQTGSTSESQISDTSLPVHQLSTQVPVSHTGLTMVLGPAISTPIVSSTIKIPVTSSVTYTIPASGSGIMPLSRQPISAMNPVTQSLLQQHQQYMQNRQLQGNRRLQKQILLGPSVSSDSGAPGLTPVSAHHIQQIQQRISTGVSGGTMILTPSSSTTTLPILTTPSRFLTTSSGAASSSEVITLTSQHLSQLGPRHTLISSSSSQQHIQIQQPIRSRGDHQQSGAALQLHQLSPMISSHAGQPLVRSSTIVTQSTAAGGVSGMPMIALSPIVVTSSRQNSTIIPFSRQSEASMNQRVAQTILEQQRQISAQSGRPIQVYSHSKHAILPAVPADTQTSQSTITGHQSLASAPRLLTGSGLSSSSTTSGFTVIPATSMSLSTSIQPTSVLSGPNVSLYTPRMAVLDTPDSGSHTTPLPLNVRPTVLPAASGSQMIHLVSHSGITNVHAPSLTSSASSGTALPGSTAQTTQMIHTGTLTGSTSISGGIMTLPPRPSPVTLNPRFTQIIRPAQIHAHQLQPIAQGKVVISQPGATESMKGQIQVHQAGSHILVTHAGQTMVFAPSISQAASGASIITSVPSTSVKMSVMIPSRTLTGALATPRQDLVNQQIVKTYRERIAQQQQQQQQQIQQQQLLMQQPVHSLQQQQQTLQQQHSSQVQQTPPNLQSLQSSHQLQSLQQINQPTKIVISQAGQTEQQQASNILVTNAGQTMILAPSQTQSTSGITIPLTPNQTSIMFPTRAGAPGVMSIHTGQSALPMSQKGQTVLLQQAPQSTIRATTQQPAKILITPQSQAELQSQQLQHQPIQVHGQRFAGQGQGPQTMILSPSMSIVAVRSAQGIRLVKQQMVAGKSVTRPVSDADLQLFLKQHGYTQQTTRVAVSLPVTSQPQNIIPIPIAMTTASPVVTTIPSVSNASSSPTQSQSSNQPAFRTMPNGPMLYSFQTHSVPTTTSQQN